VLPRRQQHSYPDIFIVDILEQAIIGRQGKCFSRPQRGKHTITIIEIKYKYDLEINAIVPEALAQHENLEQDLLAYGRKAVNVHAFIIGSAGTISQSLHNILASCGLPKIESRQRLLDKLAADSVARTANIVRLRNQHNKPPTDQLPSRATEAAPQEPDNHSASPSGIQVLHKQIRLRQTLILCHMMTRHHPPCHQTPSARQICQAHLP